MRLLLTSFSRNLFSGIIIILFVWLSFVTAQNSSINISEGNGILSIENERFVRQFKYDNSVTNPTFFPVSWKDKSTGKELLKQPSNEWFEFSIENQLMRSEDGGWEYQGFDKRNLENGGVEIVIGLNGHSAASVVHNQVRLNYYLQIFPNSTLVREKLVILPQQDQTVRLTKHEGELNLVFPKYNFSKPKDSSVNVQEVRLAEWQGEVLPQANRNIRPNNRLQLSGGKSGRNLSQNHMYHPAFFETALSSKKSSVKIKGPIGIAINDKTNIGIITAYEHGSPDADETQNYLAICYELNENISLTTQVKALKGAYYDGEKIDSEKGYSTVWVHVGYFNGTTFDEGQAVFWDFLYKNQSEHLASRKPTIYYNTWGMQRDDQKEKKKRPQEILDEHRVLQEIEYAHQLGIDVFVIDDGWQDHFGDWKPVTDRFPNGFKTIKARLDSLGMCMGLWMAAEGIAPDSKLYKEHPEWLVRNEDGSETIGRWNKPIGCFSSGYKEYFTQLCKNWIDQGFTYFKWDGLDKHLCYSSDHNHGDESITPEERAYRSGYDFILSVTDVARELTEYEPNLVIVFDMTEEQRNLGLAFLSEARYFWINNGAAWYDDLSYYRAKSIRSVTNLYNQIIPTVLQTSANYPHQSEMYGAQQYNVNTTLLGGGGFWGDLSEMTDEERLRVGEKIRLYKRVSPVVVSTRPKVTGSIGSSPEIYEYINSESASGAVISFSGSALQTTYKTQRVDKENFFCVLRNAYTLQEDGTIELPLSFPQPDATNEAFIISNSHFPVYIKSSTCWLRDAEIIGPSSFSFINGAPGEQKIIWPTTNLSKPEVISSDEKNTKVQFNLVKNNWIIKIVELKSYLSIFITSKQN